MDFYEKNSDFVIPESRFNEIKGFTKNGLQDFSISRLKEKMSWGVPVPNDEKHVMYVWFDALVNYISALEWPENTEKFNDFWPGLQVAGKDNLRQQSSMWQAMLMSAGLPNSKQIFIHGFITSSGQKMSKSLGNVVDPFSLVEKYGTDAVRYFLLREILPTEDGDFTYEKFEQRYNADLAGGIGNLVARVLGIVTKILNFKFEILNKFENKNLQKNIKQNKEKYNLALESFKFNEALISVWDIIGFCDKYINEEKLWQTQNPKVVNDLFLAIKEIADLLNPFLPETSEKIEKALEEKKSVALFPRIEKQNIEN